MKIVFTFISLIVIEKIHFCIKISCEGVVKSQEWREGGSFVAYSQSSVAFILSKIAIYHVRTNN